MTRLLLKYFFAFILATAFIGIILYVIADRMQQNSIAKMVEAPNLAIFRGLESRLKNIPVSDWPKFIEHWQPTESSQISLLPEQEIPLSKKDIQQLNSGKPVTVFFPMQYYFGYGLATTTTYWKINGARHVLKITSLSMPSLAQQISGWMIRLMKLNLEQTPVALWPQKIQQMQVIYHLPLAVSPLHALSADHRILQNLMKHQVTLAAPNAKGNIEYVYVPLNIQDFILKVGPIPYSVYPQYGRLLLISIWLILAVIVMVIATWLFSRNLDKIYYITQQYSQGNFVKLPAIQRKSILYTLYNYIIQMGAQLQQLIDNQRNITRFIAHDCRTPVSTMRFAIHYLEKENLPDDAIKQILSMKEDLSELNTLIDQFLSYERLAAQPLFPKRQHLSILSWLNASLEKYQQIPQKISLISNLNDNDAFYVDPHLLKQALTNLMDNAMKHGGGCIQVTAKKESEFFVLQVADDGAPIPESDRQRIFQPFTRLADDENRQTSGFGLGLAIVKAIVIAHHGEILVSDTDLGGACFTIRLPIHSI